MKMIGVPLKALFIIKYFEHSNKKGVKKKTN